MVSADYEFIYKKSNGERLETLNRKKVATMDYVRKELEVGAMSMTIPINTIPDRFLAPDSIIEVWRTIQDRKYLSGGTFWYLRWWQFGTFNGADVINMRLVDTNYLLEGAIAAYAADTSYTKKSDYADDMMKAIVRENRGSLATDTDRDISANLSVAGDVSLAPIIQKAFAWNLNISTLKDIANKSLNEGTYLVFDTVKTNDAVSEFRTYIDQRGTDHGSNSSSKFVFSRDNGNLANDTLTYDYMDISNAVYAGGQGQSEARQIATALDASSLASSPVARRESFVNASQSDSINYIQSIADSKLQERRARVILGGRIAPTKKFVYGIDYNFGDLVVGEKRDISFDCHIDTEHITLNPDGSETLDLRLRGEQFL
jgi:hypothetical protein